jgi:formylglycine-generating enzyme required for sulfatase activity
MFQIVAERNIAHLRVSLRGPQLLAVAGLEHIPPLELGGYWIDRFEVTNRDYKRFVDSGGYTEARFWTGPLVKEGRTLPKAEAMQVFGDATGRPGPSTWEFGSYPDGKDEEPVGGVSWYEAAAYAAFAGKELAQLKPDW